MNHRKSQVSSVKYMLAGGSVVAALGLMVDPRGFLPTTATGKDICQVVVQPEATLTRQELSRLLTVQERSDKAQIRRIAQNPYCKLPDIQIRSGVTAQREAYPLAFDSQTWLVVLYEGNEYAGYAFSFRH